MTRARFELLRAAALLIVAVPALVAWISLGSAEQPVDDLAAECRVYCSHGEFTDFCCEVCETCPITGQEN